MDKTFRAIIKWHFHRPYYPKGVYDIIDKKYPEYEEEVNKPRTTTIGPYKTKQAVDNEIKRQMKGWPFVSLWPDGESSATIDELTYQQAEVIWRDLDA